MHRFTCFLLGLFCFGLAAKTQVNRNSVLVQNLLADSTSIANISYEWYSYVNITERPFNEHPQQLLKNKNDVYVFLDGSGRLYKAFKNEKGIVFERIDTTMHFGYNYGCFLFSYNDTIYTLGGYGFWRINGQLRKYIEKTKQWDIVKLNEELPLQYEEKNTLLWYDQTGKKIYIGISRIRDEAVKSDALNETEFVYEVSVLDLVTKDWKKLGKLSAWLKDKTSIIDNITSSPWGQLVFSGNKLMLVDFAGNRLLSLNPSVESLIISSLAPQIGENAFYFKDSILFAANSLLNRIDSFALSQSDFIATNEVVFEPLVAAAQTAAASNNYKWYWIFPLIMVAFGIGWFAANGKKKIPVKPANQSLQTTSQNGNGIHHVTFDERELEVLKLVYANSSSAKDTTIEDLNKVLGLTKRNIETQKKQRSDVITSINRKYRYIHSKTENVLDKKRSEFDKRSYDYFIVFESLENVSKLLEAPDSKA